MSWCNSSRATISRYPWSTGGHGGSVLIVALSWLWCRVHLWRWRGCKNKRRWLSRAVGSLCQSRGRGRIGDRSGSRYRLWWFVHFTFFYGTALGWRCGASLPGIITVTVLQGMNSGNQPRLSLLLMKAVVLQFPCPLTPTEK